MPVSKELLLAILAMDSYNRGYNAGLEIAGTTVGTATVTTDSTAELGLANTSAAGFYAAAYSTQYGTVISYRGTDNPDVFGTASGASDFWNGWKEHFPEIWPAG